MAVNLNWRMNSRVMLGHPDPRIVQNFVCGMQYPRLWNPDFSSRNPESSWRLEFGSKSRWIGIRNHLNDWNPRASHADKESEIILTIGIRDWQVTLIRNPEFSTLNPESTASILDSSTVLGSLTWGYLSCFFSIVQITVGSFSNEDGDGSGNVTFKMNSRFFKLCRVYCNSLKMSDVDGFFRSWFLGDRIQV